MVQTSFNIAIDGPAGAGKSTIAKEVAKKMQLIYVDTGAMYRAIALYMIRSNVKKDDIERIIELCDKIFVTIGYEDGVQIVYLNDEVVNNYIRTEEVGNMASNISAIPQVRERILDLQKNLAANTDCIMDGRDIGTFVLPKADVKIYLTASVMVRAKRRYKELTEKGICCDFEQIRIDIEERDNRDMCREIAPLKQAEDAVLVDTSEMNAQQAIDCIISIITDKKKGASGNGN